MKGHQPTIPSQANPVLYGLETAGIAGKYIADIAGVSASTVSKWRSGDMTMPKQTLVFLTLVLASLVEDMETLERRLGNEGCEWNDAFDEQLHALRQMLKEQEIYNARMPPEVVLGGASLFRKWLETSGGTGSPVVDPSNRASASLSGVAAEQGTV